MSLRDEFKNTVKDKRTTQNYNNSNNNVQATGCATLIFMIIFVITLLSIVF